MKKNILLIVIDTARAKSFSSLGSKVKTTPALDALGQEGMYFTRCISPAPWTSPSHASIFTGKYPSEHGTSGRNILFNSQDNLASEFKRAGYKTFGISANHLVSSSTGFHQGYDTFIDPWTPFKEKPLKKDLFDLPDTQARKRHYLEKFLFLLSKEGINVHFNKRFGVNQNATHSTNRAMRFIKCVFSSVKEPKFIFVNIMQPHEKYNPPRRYVQKLGYSYEKIQWPNFIGYYAGNTKIDEETRKTMRTLYEGEILFADEKICALLEWMKKKKHLDNTIVVVTSDHGEHIGEHDFFSHFFSLYNELLHVPLIIYHPDYLGIGKKNDLIQTHDLYLTLLEAELGISAKFRDINSEYGPINLFTGKRKNAIAQLLYPIWIKGIIRHNPAIKEETSELASRQLAIFQHDDGGKLEKICWDSRKGITVYNLENDWKELNPLNLNSIQQETARNAIVNASRETNFNLDEDRELDIPTEILKRLSALGYM